MNQPTTNLDLDTLLEVELPSTGDFLKVKETLTRIGVASFAHGRKTLYQSCHILHKRGRYFIVHFKELFALDPGREANISDDDIARRNRIANLLSEWGLVRLVNPEQSKSPQAELSSIKVLKHSERDDWTLSPKYSLGKKLNSPQTHDSTEKE